MLVNCTAMFGRENVDSCQSEREHFWVTFEKYIQNSKLTFRMS